MNGLHCCQFYIIARLPYVTVCHTTVKPLAQGKLGYNHSHTTLSLGLLSQLKPLEP